ncbi:hypothetical protein GCM10011375_37070 [Hymenobacter qilianensis]|uniref:Uncharacterized protein n=2 Tax=Hymenobacter qilianensis TaxID=1385715 RepID=A0ACB5PWB8_9BACT|nr:hypothetical protein [Hymenobacter qilianensis]QNP51078.1 hypothetical protein H9L05_13250 [Hymenobacter qilianensis]GGF78556.1 hypothetical protein GCM10011375_37070 [Hymenobacter qilianensis]
MNKLVLLLLLLLKPALATHAASATHAAVVPDSAFVRQTHRRPVFQFDQRFSLLNGKVVGINGLKGGIEFNGRLRAGLGVYLLSGGVPTDAPLPPDLPPNTRDELRFRYLVGYGEYVLIGNPRWELSTPVQIGLGKFYSRYELPNGQVRRSDKDQIYILEPSIVSHYRVFKWLGLGGGAGYRQMLFINDKLEDELSGVIFYGRVKLFLGDLYKIMRGRQRLLSQDGLRAEDWQK